jgi:YVTN family beta-propeller protein
MDFRILGPIEVWADGRPVALGGGQQRAVLALLLLEANRVVSSDRLIDELWDGHPPATAATALQGHISALRKALGSDVIATRRPGYLFALDPEQTDLGRFERLRGEAHRALERGDAGAGAEKLREALALWRGEALADVGFEPSIRGEAARLEDLRLATLEDRIDADLAVGRSADLVDELERLVAANPLREHFWGQLMLALYRAGRQADALDAYRRARRALVAELGLEPGPALRELERQMLAQDPALDPEPQPLARARPPTPRRRWAWLVAGVLAICAVVLVAVLLTGSDSPPIPRNSVTAIDPGDNSVVKSIQLDPTPGALAAGAGGLWVVSRGSWTMARIDPRTRRLVRSFGLGENPDNVAADGEVWVSDGCAIGGDPGQVDHPWTGAGGGIDLDDEIPLDSAFAEAGPRLTEQNPEAACGLAASGTSAWVATNIPQGVVQVDYDRAAARSRVVRATPLARAPNAMTVGFGSLWASDSRANLVRRLDPESGRTVRRIRVGNDPVALAAGAGAVWVANRGDNSVSRLDPGTNSVSQAISVGESPAAVAVGSGSVWVANAGEESVARVDPASNKVTDTISVDHHPQGVAVAGGLVWVTLR